MQKLNFAKAALRGQAKEWCRIVGHMAVPKYEAFKEKLLRVYPDVVDRVALEEELLTVRQRQNQAAAPFVLHKIDLISKLGVHEYTTERALAIILSRMLPDLQERLELNPSKSVFIK